MKSLVLAATLLTLGAVALSFLGRALVARDPTRNATGAVDAHDASVLTASAGARLFELHALAPGISSHHARRTVVASEALRTRLDAEPEPAATDLGELVRDRLAAVVVNDTDARAYFRANPALFGERSFEESRPVVRQLVALRRVREELNL